jgi:rfaE bifunctional protein nucleotidyltransferase chain/domain
MEKVIPAGKLVALRRRLRARGKTVVFTNGTFDILHSGHVQYLTKARRMGDVLVVGLNTDASIRKIKGPRRPINGNADRAAVLAGLAAVDYICFFGTATPLRLIERLLPDVLVKGADWRPGSIVGGDVVRRHGGKVRRVALTRGRSTSTIIERVLAAYDCSAGR